MVFSMINHVKKYGDGLKTKKTSGGFHSHWGTPSSLDGLVILVRGKSQSQRED